MLVERMNTIRASIRCLPTHWPRDEHVTLPSVTLTVYRMLHGERVSFVPNSSNYTWAGISKSLIRMTGGVTRMAKIKDL